MILIKDISSRLLNLNFPLGVLDNYNEPHRFYHNQAHLLDVVNHLNSAGEKNDELFLAAVYHDAVYDPRANDNEENSAKLFLKDAGATALNETSKQNIKQLILDTKNHKPSGEQSKLLLAADLAIFEKGLGELIKYEKGIFKEFQFANYPDYKVKRIEILKGLNTKGKLDALIEYVENRKPLIGVFCGSFNPFHKGHYNVLQKAEKIFDKVIIAFGKNPEKDQRDWKVPKTIQNRQLEEYNGLLTDFITSLGHDVVVVRGLRNSTDFQYEQNQYRYIQELMPEIKIVNIFCDKEFEHISSSGIRTLEKFNKHKNYLLE